MQDSFAQIVLLSLENNPILLLLLLLFSHQVLSNSFATPWTVASQAPLSMGFFRQEYWSGLPFPPPGDLPDPGIEPSFPRLSWTNLVALFLFR